MAHYSRHRLDRLPPYVRACATAPEKIPALLRGNRGQVADQFVEYRPAKPRSWPWPLTSSSGASISTPFLTASTVSATSASSLTATAPQSLLSVVGCSPSRPQLRQLRLRIIASVTVNSRASLSTSAPSAADKCVTSARYPRLRDRNIRSAATHHDPPLFRRVTRRTARRILSPRPLELLPSSCRAQLLQSAEANAHRPTAFAPRTPHGRQLQPTALPRRFSLNAIEVSQIP
jgi:hypothetical protein